MSKMSVNRDLLVTKLNTALANKYEIVTKINPDGYDSPFIVIDGYYRIAANDSTTQSKRTSYAFNILIGENYRKCSSSTDEDTKTEALEEDIETILKLALRIKEDEIGISDDVNKGDPAKVALFTLIVE